MKLKIYAWTGYWRDPRNLNRSGQADFVCAAASKASIKRRIGTVWGHSSHEMREVTNLAYFQFALGQPESVLARGLDNHGGEFTAILKPGEVHPIVLRDQQEKS